MNVTASTCMTAAIMIVDDNPVNVQLLQVLLEDEGYRKIEGITQPLQVEQRVIENRPDLILLDVRMPRLNGLELMKRLMQSLGADMPPVIFLTAQIDEDTRHQALSLGAHDFLTKPFNHQEVMQRIRNILQRNSLKMEYRARAELMETLVRQRTVELEKLSRQDPATALPNRRALLEMLQQTRQNRQPVVVYMISVQGVEQAAMLHGLSAAEELVNLISERLNRQVNGSDLLGVWSSSDWVLVDQSQVNGDAEQRSQQLLQQFNKPFWVQSRQLHVQVKIGIAHSRGDHSPEQLMRMAALALPEQQGRSREYALEIDHALTRSGRVHEALKQAVARRELSLMFQPKVDLNSGYMVGAEVLLRWNSAEFSWVSPAEFIPLAESGGEIIELGNWVIQQALGCLSRWRSKRLVPEDFSLAINVSANQLMQEDFAIRLEEQIVRFGIPAERVEVEVTESGLMKNMQMASDQLSQLNRAGVGIAIDDFGTGYSSLSYLKALPVSVLKIDRSFVRELHNSLQDQRLVETVISMAGHFGFKTVAEGVEQAAQLELLRRIGCHLIQGYFLSPPLVEDELHNRVFTPLYSSLVS
ncbi:putative bifunctional diguanylate cyclase/phosphodiesterase [Neptuniibacter halophilus]|uniref:putative bifunctional diguanylate cyclase/phosphodiesterase n=1 Tax=Neptuniibacter halophilus TaxID=651666 RepID=UPI002573D3E7|nr:EAL domain-containing protein [Neptuniibacter halophilus]